MVDLIKRNTTTIIAGNINYDILLNADTTVTVDITRGNGVTDVTTWGTDSLGKTDWEGGTYTWRLRVVNANNNLSLTEVRLIRYASDGSTEQASKSSGAISVSLGTTGVKSNTISWNDGTQNPAGRASSDRFAVEYKIANVGKGGQTVGIGTNLTSSNDEITTPLQIGQNYNVPISESSISVGAGTIVIQGAYNKSISETSISVSEQIQRGISRNIVEDAINTSEGLVLQSDFIRPISESSISVSDQIARGITVTKPLSETSISVSDGLIAVGSFNRPISEPSNSVSDDIVTQFGYNIPLSEPSISVSDDLQKIFLPVLHFDVRFWESPISVYDSVFPDTSNVIPLIESAISVSDQITRLLEAQRPISETAIAVSEDLTAESIQEYNVPLVETSISVSDQIARQIDIIKTLTETSISVSDQITRLLEATRTISETPISVSDQLIAYLSAFASISETSISVSDQVVATLVATVLISESTISVSDQITRILAATRPISESSISVSDQITKQISLLIPLSEPSISVSDSVIGDTSKIVTLIESAIIVSDQITRGIAIIKPLSETSISVDDILIVGQAFDRPISETAISVSDQIAKLLTFNRQLTESSIDVSDQIARGIAVNRAIAETSITVIDDLQRSVAFDVPISEPSNSVSDQITRILAAVRVITETSISVSDQLIRQLTSLRTLSEPSISVNDSIYTTTVLEYQANLIESAISVSDQIDRLITVNRQITESTINVYDSILVSGGIPPIVVTEEFKVSVAGSVYDYSRLKKKILLNAFNIENPFADDKVYINNQRAFMIDPDNTPMNIISSPVRVKARLYNTIKSNIRTRKQIRDDEHLQQVYQKYKDTKSLDNEFISKLPDKTYIINYKNNKILTNSLHSIKSNIAIKSNPRNISIISSNLIIKPNNTNIIESPLLIKSNETNSIKSNIYIETFSNHNIKSKLMVKPKIHNIVNSKIIESKKNIAQKVMNILKYRNTDLRKAFHEVFGKSETKEHLLYYIQTYQEKFNVEKTVTNKKASALEKLYRDKFVYLYSKIVDEYKDRLTNFEEAKLKYGDEVRQLIRTVAQKDYELGIDYVANSLDRPDIYLSQTDLDNIKKETDKAYVMFFDSIYKHIKALQYESQRDLVSPEVQKLLNEKIPKAFPIPDSVILFLNGMSTGLIALATLEKTQEMEDQLLSQNIRFIFVTAWDDRVCPQCLPLDYRVSSMSFSKSNYYLIPNPPLHFRCRCRVLMKIGNEIIKG